MGKKRQKFGGYEKKHIFAAKEIVSHPESH